MDRTALKRTRSRALTSLLASVALSTVVAGGAAAQEPVAGGRFNQQRPDLEEQTFSVEFPYDPVTIRLLLDQPSDGEFFSGQIAGLGIDWKTRAGTFSGAYRSADLGGETDPIETLGLGFDDGTWRAALAATSQDGAYASVARVLGALDIRGEYRSEFAPEDASAPANMVRPLLRTTFAGTGIQARADIPTVQEGTPTSGVGLGATWTRGAHAFDLDLFSGTERYLGSPSETDLAAIRAAYRIDGERLASLLQLETHRIGDSLYRLRFGAEQSFRSDSLDAGLTAFYNGLGTSITDAATAYESFGIGVRAQPRIKEIALGPFATFERDTILPSETVQYGIVASWRGWGVTAGQSRTTRGRDRFATEHAGYVAGVEIPITSALALRFIAVDEGVGEDQYGDPLRLSQGSFGIVYRAGK